MMEVTFKNLRWETKTIDDPGDYPSNAGGGRLPDYEALDYISGVIELELKDEEARRIYNPHGKSLKDIIVGYVREEMPEVPEDTQGNPDNMEHRISVTIIVQFEESNPRRQTSSDPDPVFVIVKKED